MVSVNKDLNVSSPVKGIPTASTAYVLYKVGETYCSATRHAVDDGKLGMGKVISLKSLADQLGEVGPGAEPAILPDSVFIHTTRLFGWTTPTRKHPMWFNVGGKRRGCNVVWPNMLWLADTKQRLLRVFAIGKGGRPGYESPVYHAPLMNIDSWGRLCEGSAHLPRKMTVEKLAEIEACVFDSYFTHVNHEKTLRCATDNRGHIRFWRTKERTRENVRVRELVRIGTLREVL